MTWTRRGFLGMLAGVPLLGKLVPASALPTSGLQILGEAAAVKDLGCSYTWKYYWEDMTGCWEQVDGGIPIWLGPRPVPSKVFFTKVWDPGKFEEVER